MKESRFSGIDGVEGSEHIYAVVSLGKKNPNGWPIETRQFHIVNKKEVDGRRQPHPDFAAFNNAPKEERITIRGNIMHADKKSVFNFQRMNFLFKDFGMHPFKYPFCEGDGKRARRWTGKAPSDFDDIECPNNQCPFHISKECKSFMRFYFRIRWNSLDKNQPLVNQRFASLPTVMVKYVSRGWHTVENFEGFFNDVKDVALGLGLKNYSLAGLPFVMTVAEEKQKPKGPKDSPKNYPVVTIATETDMLSFFEMQHKLKRYLSGGIEPAGLLSDGEQEPEVIAADWRSVTVVDVNSPAEYEEPEEKKPEPPKSKEPDKPAEKKYVPMSLSKLTEMAKLDKISDKDLPYFIHDTFALTAEHNGMSKPDAYKLLFGSENEKGEVGVVEWDVAKKDVTILRKFETKARRAILNMSKQKEQA